MYRITSKYKQITLNSLLIDASVVRAVQPIVVPGHDTVAGESVVGADGAAVAGNKSRYLKGNVTYLAEYY